MAKTKNKAKEKKYVSPWEITKKNSDHYKVALHGGTPSGKPVDWDNLKTYSGKPSQGRGWLNKGEILNEKKELKNG